MKKIVIILILTLFPILSFAQDDLFVEKVDSTSVNKDSVGWDKSADNNQRIAAWKMRDMFKIGIQNDNYNANIPRFRLFPTTNMWTFIKLDTRSGRMWQIQYSIEGDKYRFETELNDTPLVFSFEEGFDGRFTLIPTQNAYNFILLDQYSGMTFQTQWSRDPENRGVIPILTEGLN